MAYRFVRTSGSYVEFSSAPLSGYTFGPLTFAIFFKAAETFSRDFFALRGAADRIYVYNSGTDFGLANPANAGPTGALDTTSWILLVYTCAGTGSVPRYHIHKGTSWSHGNTSGTATAAVISAGDALRLATRNPAASTMSLDIVCAGIKKADSADLTVETLSRTAFSAWRSFGFDWLVGLDTSLETAGVLQDQATPGTGDEVTRVAVTTGVSDPPSWAWLSAATPVANFTGTPTSGTEPLSVTFTDSSTNTPTSWAWTFGDGGTSTSQNPTHSYTTPGTYTVVLVATNSAGSDTKTRTGYITVSDQPRPIRINTSAGWADIGDATSFVSGTGAPTAAVGATGAIYLDVSSGLRYGPKAAGAWPGTPIAYPASTPADATTSSKGIVQLAADLTGTAAAPQLKIPYGTTLPASPADGQEAILVDSTTNPSYQWRFRYNAGSSSAYKWEFVGGPPMRASVGATEPASAGGGVWQDLATAGPLLTVPRSGDYLIEAGADMRAGSGSDAGTIGVSDNGVASPTVMAVINVDRTNAAQSGSMFGQRTLTAGWIPRLRYNAYVNVSTFSNRWFKLTPVRVS